MKKLAMGKRPSLLRRRTRDEEKKKFDMIDTLTESTAIGLNSNARFERTSSLLPSASSSSSTSSSPSKFHCDEVSAGCGEASELFRFRSCDHSAAGTTTGAACARRGLS